MNEPVILRFPAPAGQSPANASPLPAIQMADVDLQTILQAWNEATDRLQHTHEALRAEVSRLSDELEAKNREDLQKKEFEGERNVLTTRIESLEKAVKDLTDQNARLSKQLEAAYQKLQEIAEKTIESAGQGKSLADLQKLLVEQGRRTAGEK